jgi:hypothetical protein
MSGFVITQSTGLKCVHSPGPTPDITYPRVKIGGQPIVLQGYPYTIKTCTVQTKCTAGSWTKGAQKVRAGGIPVAISTGVSLLAPAGSFTVLLVQQRVRAT